MEIYNFTIDHIKPNGAFETHYDTISAENLAEAMEIAEAQNPTPQGCVQSVISEVE